MDAQDFGFYLFAGISTLCGIGTGIYGIHYLGESNKPIISFEDITKLQNTDVFFEGIALPVKEDEKNQDVPLCLVSKTRTFNISGTQIKKSKDFTLVIHNQNPFYIVSSEGKVIVVPSNNTKLKGIKNKEEHAITPLTLIKSLELLVSAAMSWFISARISVEVSRKVTNKVITTKSRVFVTGKAIAGEITTIVPSFIGSSRHSYLKTLTPRINYLLLGTIFFGSLAFFCYSPSKKIEKISEKIPVELRCIVCKSRARNIILWPCKHFICCKICRQDHSRCPKCNKIIEFYYEINS